MGSLSSLVAQKKWHLDGWGGVSSQGMEMAAWSCSIREDLVEEVVVVS